MDLEYLHRSWKYLFHYASRNHFYRVIRCCFTLTQEVARAEAAKGSNVMGFGNGYGRMPPKKEVEFEAEFVELKDDEDEELSQYLGLLGDGSCAWT